jgi:tetratricopeptide (TPR) repeat protein
MTTEQLKRFSYALGKAYNDQKNFEKAFPCFQKAASLFDNKKSLGIFYDLSSAKKNVFSTATINKLKDTGNPSRMPIFIVGMPRSGTTLTEQILASHPLVCGVGELPALGRIAFRVGLKNGNSATLLKALKAITPAIQNELGETYLNTVRPFGNGEEHFVDKMPHNFMHVGLINIIFPNARIIHCLRNPIDNCVSIYTSPLNDGHDYAKDLTNLGLYYREYASLMDYWKTVSAIPIFDMKYETTVADLEGQARALIAHVGLPWNDACLKFNEAKTQVSTISTWQVRQPIYSTSVKRWKAYEKHLGPLIDALGDLADTD